MIAISSAENQKGINANVLLRTRRALTLFNIDLLKTRRALSLPTLYDSTLLVLNETLVNNNLMPFWLSTDDMLPVSSSNM